MAHRVQLGQGSSLLVSGPVLALFGGGLLVCLRLANGLAAGLCLFFLLLGLTSRWWGSRAIHQVSIRVACPRPRLYPGQQTSLIYQVDNGKALPLVWLELSQNGPKNGCLAPDEAFEAYFPAGQSGEGGAVPFLRQSFSFVGSYQTVRVDSTWTARRRGIYHMDRLLARSGDGFGLTQREQVLPAEALPVLVVYPRAVEVDLSLFLRPQWDCAAGRRGWMEDQTVLRGSREYQPGDNWKQINWRMAAREQGLPVNLYQTIQPRGVHLILDGESFCGLSPGYEELEHVLEILASVLTGLSGAGVACALTLPQSRRFGARTLYSGEDGAVGELLYHLSGYDCLAQRNREVEEGAGEAVFFPSRFGADCVEPVGMTYLVTNSGGVLPAGLIGRLDPGRLCVLALRDWEACAQAGLSGLALDSLCRGGQGR